MELNAIFQQYFVYTLATLYNALRFTAVICIMLVLLGSQILEHEICWNRIINFQQERQMSQITPVLFFWDQV